MQRRRVSVTQLVWSVQTPFFTLTSDSSICFHTVGTLWRCMDVSYSLRTVTRGWYASKNGFGDGRQHGSRMSFYPKYWLPPFQVHSLFGTVFLERKLISQGQVNTVLNWKFKPNSISPLSSLQGYDNAENVFRFIMTYGPGELDNGKRQIMKRLH